MSWSYSPLWHMLVDKKMKKSELIKYAGLNSSAITKMSKDEPVTMNTLDKLCNKFGCRVEDIVLHIPDDNKDNT